METNEYRRRHRAGESWDEARWVPAFVLIVVGGIFLLNNLRIIPFRELFQYWPVALIALGLFRLVDSTYTNQRLLGAIVMAVGGLLLAGTLGFYPLTWGMLWPLLLIGAGLLMLVQRLSVSIGVNMSTDSATSSGGAYSATAASPQWLHELAIFSGGKRRIKGDFQGGKLDCVFGGFEINLRQATMSADFAEIEINAIFGGAEIKVPQDWEVVIRGVGILGAFADSTEHPDPQINSKRLIVKGAAFCGGVEVKN